MECALNMSGICKSYGGVPVLRDVDLQVGSGEIHALLGENGAGKTTLMNILGGVTPMDRGNIALFGEDAKIARPADSQALGVAFIHQELNVINDLPVYENMFLGHELGARTHVDARAMCRRTQEVFDRMHVDIDPRATMRDLQTSYKQIVEIAKAILMDAKLVIMDEPTTSLTQQEAENVFAIMRGLTQEHGVTIIFISHKLGEVVEFCDSYTVLRNGEKVADGKIADKNGVKISQADIAKMMCGSDVLSVDVYQPHEIGDVVLEVQNLSVDKRVRDISFTARRGEILGFTGLLGDGKDELVRSLFGDLPRTGGKVIKDGVELTHKHPAKAKKLGIGFLPSNRKENAIIKDLSVQDNMTIVTLDRFRIGPHLVKANERHMAEDYKERLNIKVENLANKITSLSGGNQLKAVLAKWLNAKPEIMILSNPTQGVDVGAKNEIYSLIMEIAKEGVCVIVTSSEAQEIMRICDRVLIMYHGELKGELDRQELTEETIMILATGGTLD